MEHIPLDLIHEGNLLGAISGTHVLTGLSVILATSVAVMGQLYQVEKRRKIIEPDAFAVITIVIGAMFTLYWRRRLLTQVVGIRKLSDF